LFQKGDYTGENSLRKLTITFHGMKCSLTYIGELSLSELAKKMEMACREHRIGYIEAYVPEFTEGLRALLERIEPAAVMPMEEIAENEDIDALHDTLLTLQELCAEYNRKGALELLSGVKQCTEETRTILNNINKHIMQSDYEEAETAAAAYISRLKISA